MEQLKVKWRQHGLIVITLIIVIVACKHLYTAFIKLNGLDLYVSAFQNNHLVYNKYEHFILPEIGALFLFYVAYLWISFFTIPRFIAAMRKNWLAYVWAALQLVIIGYLLALGFNIATYFAKPYLYSYSPAFMLYALFGYNERPLQDLFFGFSSGMTIVLVYTCYAAIKEYLIYRAEKSAERTNRVLLMNRLTGFWIIYITVPIFCLVFNLVDNNAIYRGYFALLTLIVIAYIIQQNLRAFRLRRAEQALTRTKADLLFLRSQINPHFLFNVLNTLYGTAIMDGSKRTAEGIQKLGDMMRFMLRENHLDFIPLSKEIAYLQNYIALQKLRLPDDSVSIEISIDDTPVSQLIVPMMLIPFVENAFKHGVRPPERSWIKITLQCDARQIRFEVRNSLFAAENKDPEAEYSGIGLQNVQERLNLFYPDKHQLKYGAQAQEFVAGLVIDTFTEPLAK